MSDPRDASGYSASDLISMGFINTPSLAALVEKTKPVSEINVARFDAIIVAGGQAPMFSFEKATDLHKKFVEFYEAGKIACALCHGVALLRYAKLSNGELLAKGKTVTGFANVEEGANDGSGGSGGGLVQEGGVLQRSTARRPRPHLPWRRRNPTGGNGTFLTTQKLDEKSVLGFDHDEYVDQVAWDVHPAFRPRGKAADARLKQAFDELVGAKGG